MGLLNLTLVTFILILTITHEIQYVEGRHLKHNTHHNKIHLKKTTPLNQKATHVTSTTNANEAIQTPPPPPPTPSPPTPHRAEDFRPTAPGHSPGAGHSIQN
ncbi:hypothetical protein L2E82_44010 [Cichorium intybus]|uniref:Uncharacterized protein n=1 Tax=Cichorium intybus TaxID=13427 RepID=A0ACB8ZPL2_CICIN|nr:hypothetical protein L2E82_44010 [Cichorium intybus]